MELEITTDSSPRLARQHDRLIGTILAEEEERNGLLSAHVRSGTA